MDGNLETIYDFILETISYISEDVDIHTKEYMIDCMNISFQNLTDDEKDDMFDTIKKLATLIKVEDDKAKFKAMFSTLLGLNYLITK